MERLAVLRLGCPRRIQEKTETIAGETHIEAYGFDLAGRLSDVYRDGLLAAHHEHDENGNRAAKEAPPCVAAAMGRSSV